MSTYLNLPAAGYFLYLSCVVNTKSDAASANKQYFTMKKLSSFLSFLFLLTLSLSAQNEEFGVASYYADAFHGRKTASGQMYDKGGMTAAHKELPFGTTVRVTRLDNKKSVVVRINDRGPFISGRIVELSKSAAQKIGLVRDGIAEVKLEVVTERPSTTPQPQEQLTTKSAETPKTTKPAPAPKSYDNTAADSKPVVVVPPSVKVVREPTKTAAPAAKPKPEPAKKTAAKSTPKPAEAKVKLVQSPKQDDLYQIQLIRPDKEGYGVQVAYLTDYENVFRQVADLQSEWFKNILISVKEEGKTAKYKVILGPFPDLKTAEAYKSSLQKKKNIKGFVVDLSKL